MKKKFFLTFLVLTASTVTGFFLTCIFFAALGVSRPTALFASPGAIPLVTFLASPILTLPIMMFFYMSKKRPVINKNEMPMTPEKWNEILEKGKIIASSHYLGIQPESFDEFDPRHVIALNQAIPVLLSQCQNTE